MKEKSGQNLPMLLLNFSTRVALKNYGSRNYASRLYTKARKNDGDWSSVFNVKTPRNVAVNRFKAKLSNAIERKQNPKKLSLESDAIESLLSKCSVRENDDSNSIKRLYYMILQRRISDDTIYDAITKAAHNNVINVSIPKHINKAQSYPLNTKYQPLLKIYPQEVDHLGQMLQKIQSNDENTELNKTVLNINGAQHVENSSTEPDSKAHHNIDLRSLEIYLRKAERDEAQRRKYAWEEQTLYKWNQPLNHSLELSAGQLLFRNKNDFIRRPMRQTVMERLLNRPFLITSSSNSSKHNVQPTELLIYNLSKKLKTIIKLEDENSMFNINYKDLFGIINSSNHPPEETLSVINRFEHQGWKLVGDLYDNSQDIVFQRTNLSKIQPWRGNFSKMQKLLVGLTISGLLYGLYGIFSADAISKEFDEKKTAS